MDSDVAAAAGADAPACAHRVKVENRTAVAVKISRFMGSPIPFRISFLRIRKTYAIPASFRVG